MKYGDDIIYDLTPETIMGPQLGGREIILELIPGDKYEIHYGIHQGIYQYEGTVVNRKNHPNFIKEHMFRKIDTGDLTFGFYGYHEPSLFTRICTHRESK